MQPSISVILATHNGERFLREQLASLRAQTVAPAQIILTDDNSTDGTDAILDEFEAINQVPLVRLKNSPELGFGDNFLCAVNYANCEWIAFCDQDDIWMPTKIEECAKFITNKNICAIAHSARLIDENGIDIGIFSQGIVETVLRDPLFYDAWSTFFGFSLVFRKSILDVLDYRTRYVDYVDPDARVSHDRLVCFLSQVLGQTQEINLALVSYRQHDGNLFGAWNKKAGGRQNFDRRFLARSIRAYVESATAVVHIIQNISDETTARFSKFDKKKALQKYQSTLDHLERRFEVYDGRNRFEVASAVAINFIKGHYVTADNGTFRWKSLCKDLLFAAGI